MAEADRVRWNERYRAGDAPVVTAANRWLEDHAALVDEVAAAAIAQGRPPAALDLACGAGGAVAWLARRGWHVTGVDISDAALGLARQALTQVAPQGDWQLLQADLDDWRPEPAAYDLITSFYFLNRRLWPALREAVRPGGLLVIETYNCHALSMRPQANPAYLLQPGELANEISRWGWHILDARSSTAGNGRDAVVATPSS
ncbi:MAG: class I SAM-dependent methyltransferase [Caldilineaceae bacterium]|nr:class I SAM-dependent methyltransferase [Caldilineaceae bacterium]